MKLNDFFEQEGISMDDFLPATVYAYSTWPKGSPNYWALPAMGDALGWVYRKDWFSRPELQAEFKEMHGYDLGVPENWNQLQDIASFFQGREIDGKTVYGAGYCLELPTGDQLEDLQDVLAQARQDREQQDNASKRASA